MTSVKVLHTVSSLEHRASGVTYCVEALVSAQSRQGVDATVFSLAQAGEKSVGGATYKAFRPDFADIPILRSFGYSRAMAQAAARAGPEIIHTHGLWLYPNVLRTREARFIITPHGMLTPVALSFSPLKKALANALFQTRALAAATMLHATAESEYDDIRRLGLKQPVAVIPNGIDIPAMTLIGDAAQPKKKEVLSLGRIHPKKGLDTLIQAWASIADVFPGWRLRIIGPDENGHARELEATVQRLNLHSVSIEPPVFGPRKTSLMSQAQLFVLPSRSENFAMTVAESLAVGVPVIATKGAPWAGLETHACGWWVDHGHEALAVAIKTALSLSEGERAAMGARGRAWMASDFGWDSIAERMTRAYQWCLGRGVRPDFVEL
jgi:glycosyltransferase involved in cell wall biosynthesis